MLTIGSQLRAGRALAGLSQRKLGAIANLSPATIAKLEGFGLKPLRADFATVQALQRALEGIGVQFIEDNRRPGVQLRYEPKEHDAR